MVSILWDSVMYVTGWKLGHHSQMSYFSKKIRFMMVLGIEDDVPVYTFIFHA